MLSAEAKKTIQQHVAALPSSLRSEPASEEQLREFEAAYEPVPDDYRWFLLTCGGGIFGSERVDNITQLMASHDKFRRESGPPRGWTMHGVFIIGWDGAGNPFGIEITSERIVVEDHNSGGTHELAATLQDFMLNGIWK